MEKAKVNPAAILSRFLEKGGLWLMKDDAGDIGSTDRVHHWQLGLSAYTASILLKELDAILEVLDALQEEG